MVRHEVFDEAGKSLFVYESTIPGLCFVPPGLSANNVKVVSEERVKKVLDKVKQVNANRKERDIIAELDAMQADVTKLKADKAPKA